VREKSYIFFFKGINTGTVPVINNKTPPPPVLSIVSWFESHTVKTMILNCPTHLIYCVLLPEVFYLNELIIFLGQGLEHRRRTGRIQENGGERDGLVLK
jgi:hypothetical protein